MAGLAPIAKGWISTTGETGAQNYDEFADDAEITAIVEANPRSMLAVEMAHRTPEMLAEGADRERSLRYAAERLQRLKDDGLLAKARDFVVAYEIDAPTGRQLGIGLMAPTAEIWDAERNPSGRIIRSLSWWSAVSLRSRHQPDRVPFVTGITCAISPYESPIDRSNCPVSRRSQRLSSSHRRQRSTTSCERKQRANICSHHRTRC